MSETATPPVPAPVRPQRTYCEADYAAVRAALAQARGNVRQASRMTGVPARTISGWMARAAEPAPPAAIPAPVDKVLDSVEAVYRRIEADYDAGGFDARPILYRLKVFGLLHELSRLLRAAGRGGSPDLSKLSADKRRTFDKLLADTVDPVA